MPRVIAAFLIGAAVCAGQSVQRGNRDPFEMPVSREIPEQDTAARLQQEPDNIALLLSMGSMKLADAGPMRDEDERAATLDEAQAYYERIVSLDAKNITALYYLGVTGWMRVFPALQTARAELAMDPETPGPLRDRDLRAVLNGKYASALNYAAASLERVVGIDPQNNDAMAYLNMVYRAKGDLEDTAEASRADAAAADRWVQRAMQSAQEKAQEKADASTAPAGPSLAQASPSAAGPARIRVGAKVQESKLIHKVEPLYPADLNSRVEGTVRLNAVIAKDGTVAKLEVVSGPPQLVPSAMEAVKEWRYRPTLLNGAPVEVTTTIEVDIMVPVVN